MRPARFLLVAVVAAAVAGLVLSWPGRGAPERATVGGDAVPSVRTGAGGSITWYCAAASASVAPAPARHLLVLTGVADRPVTVVARGFSSDGPIGASPVTVQPGVVSVLDVGATFGNPSTAVLVESPTAQVAVEHRWSGANLADADQVPCSTFSSGSWTFPTVTTTRDSAALLSLFNPFPADAGVNIEVVLDSGVRTPTSLTGVVVPARTVRVVDLGQSVQRREQFAVVVRSRSGRVVAELAQTRNGSLGVRGLRIDRGVPAPARRWAFAGGFTGPGAAERLVLQNPGSERAAVAVQVTPYGGVATAPEPLQVEVPPRQAVVVDLSAESRIPGEGYHSILVDSPEVPVVVARTIGVTAAAPAPSTAGVVGRPAVTSGLTAANGTPVGALRWLVPQLGVVTPAPVVLVHNPGERAAVMTVSLLDVDGRRPLEGFDRVEVAPGDSLAVPVTTQLVGQASAPNVALEVRAGSPVVVERLVTFGPPELSLGSAVPIRFPRGGLDRLGPD